MVAETAARDLGGLFDGLLEPELVDAYERLRARDGCPKDRAGSLLGADLVDALLQWGMAHVRPPTPADPAWLQPTSPDLALQAVLTGHQHRLVRDQQRLLDGQRRLPSAQAQFGGGMTSNARLPEHLVSVVTDRGQISDLSTSLVNTARQDWMTLENLATDMPLSEDFTQPPLPVADGQVHCRSIYAAGAMDDPAARRIIQTCAEAGEQARLRPSVPMKMKLADTSIAMLPLTPNGTAALVIRAPVILTALREYFELLWERATPLKPERQPAPGDRLPTGQQKILELMAQGHNDDAIARRLDISVVTVRRQITAIMRRLKASSRFAAGAAAQRRGWIG
jgi:DNA-binding CsgD family transcriptional regulator